MNYKGMVTYSDLDEIFELHVKEKYLGDTIDLGDYYLSYTRLSYYPKSIQKFTYTFFIGKNCCNNFLYKEVRHYHCQESNKNKIKELISNIKNKDDKKLFKIEITNFLLKINLSNKLERELKNNTKKGVNKI